MQYLVFEVDDRVVCKIPSSYLEIDNQYSDKVEKAIEEALAFYNRENCSVQILMGERVEELTRQPTVSLRELLPTNSFSKIN